MTKTEKVQFDSYQEERFDFLEWKEKNLQQSGKRQSQIRPQPQVPLPDMRITDINEVGLVTIEYDQALWVPPMISEGQVLQSRGGSFQYAKML